MDIHVCKDDYAQYAWSVWLSNQLLPKPSTLGLQGHSTVGPLWRSRQTWKVLQGFIVFFNENEWWERRPNTFKASRLSTSRRSHLRPGQPAILSRVSNGNPRDSLPDSFQDFHLSTISGAFQDQIDERPQHHHLYTCFDVTFLASHRSLRSNKTPCKVFFSRWSGCEG